MSTEPQNIDPNDSDEIGDSSDHPGRRSFFARMSSFLMMFGLASSYGMFASFAGWFLYPSGGSKKGWMFVATLDGIGKGESVVYLDPNGNEIAIRRVAKSGNASDFIALSNICPHLGCKVHWESQNNRFFCPCHNGAFDSAGKPIAGPPKDAGQSLSKYPLKVEKGLLFIGVSFDSLV